MSVRQSPHNPPELHQAKHWLESSLLRLGIGAQKTALVAAILLAVSQIIPAVRYVSADLAEVNDILPELVFDLVGVALVLLLVHWALPKVLRYIYQPLLERGRIVPVNLMFGPHSLHQRFTGQSTQPFMVRGAVEGMEILFGGWLPTRPVNFKGVTGGRKQHMGFLYADETLPGDDPAYALVDPRNPRKIWLIRQPMEAPS